MALVGAVVPLAPSSPQLPPTEFGNYERLGELGIGAYSRVFLCRREGTSENFAAKAINLRWLRLSTDSEKEVKKLGREVNILRRLPPHPNVVQLVDAVEEDNWFFIVLELVKSGDLFATLTGRPWSGLGRARFLEGEVAHVLRQLVDGLQFLHSQGVIHRDLKLENILVTSLTPEDAMVMYSIKITDFGLSKVVGGDLSEPHSMVGTKRYVAPEVLRGGAYDFRADLWSLGVVVYLLLDGRYPHDLPAKAQQETLDRAVSSLPVGDTAKAVVAGLLRLDRERRLNLSELARHAWVLGTASDTTSPEQPSLGSLPRARPDAVEAPSGRFDLEEMTSSCGSTSFGGSDSAIGRAVPGAPAPSLSMAASVVSVIGNCEAAPCPSEREPLFGSVSTTSILALSPPIPLGVPATSTFDAAPNSAASVVPVEDDMMAQGGSAPPAANEYVASSATSAIAGARDLTAAATVNLLHIIRPSADMNEVQLHLIVPSRLAGRILGGMGNTLKQIAASANCKVSLTPRDGAADRHAIVAGGFAECLVAQRLLVEQMALELGAMPAEVTAVFPVRRELAGVVIGRQGSSLKQLGEQSGARIKLSRHEVEGLRPCILTGGPEAVVEGERLIFQLMAAAPPTTPPAPMAPASALPVLPGLEDGEAPLAKRLRVEESTKFLIPAQSAGVVIGKNGSGLRLLSDRYSVVVDVLRKVQTPEWPDDRVVVVRGSAAARQAAIDAILKSVFQSAIDEQFCLKMLVPSAHAGFVIGKHGKSLQAIKEKCGIRAHVEREECMGERLVTATGHSAQVSRAVSAIFQALRC